MNAQLSHPLFSRNAQLSHPLSSRNKNESEVGMRFLSVSPVFHPSSATIVCLTQHVRGLQGTAVVQGAQVPARPRLWRFLSLGWAIRPLVVFGGLVDGYFCWFVGTHPQWADHPQYSQKRGAKDFPMDATHIPIGRARSIVAVGLLHKTSSNHLRMSGQFMVRLFKTL